MADRPWAVETRFTWASGDPPAPALGSGEMGQVVLKS